MVTTVRSRPNHYDVLGIDRAATTDQIAKAFAKLLSEPRPFGSLAEVTVAYETLRDPAKRKAYDSSLGVKAEPKPALSLAGRLEAAQFLGAGVKRPASLDMAPTPQPTLRMAPQPWPEPIVEPTKAAPVAAVQEKPDSNPLPTGETRPTEQLSRPLPQPRFHDAGETSINWRLPAIAAGALVLAVGIGAWTGWEAGNDNETVTVEVPKAKPLTPAVQPPAAAAADTLLASPSRSVSRATAAPRPARTRPPLQITLPEKQEAEVTLLEQKQRELETEQAVVESAAAPTTAAKLPLPDAVIARTIGRIGYPCGRVASAAAVDGSPGVFTVTCTSGHSYRASPVRGRYHFRRIAGR